MRRAKRARIQGKTSTHPANPAHRGPASGRSSRCRLTLQGTFTRSVLPWCTRWVGCPQLAQYSAVCWCAIRLPRVLSRFTHPWHKVHTSASGTCVAQHTHPFSPCLVAHPASFASRSTLYARFQRTSCMPRTPMVCLFRAAMTMDTRWASAAILSTCSLSLQLSFSHLSPNLVMATYE